MADEPDEPGDAVAAAPVEEDWTPPREMAALLAALAAVACAGSIVAGVPKKWTAPTLGVLLLLGSVETLIAVGLVLKATLAERRRSKPVYIASIAVTALGALLLAGLLLLSGII